MKNKNISALINAYSTIQKENIFIVGCAKNIVALRKLQKENNEAIELLHNRDSVEKWVYVKPESENIHIIQLIPIVKDGEYVKSDGNLEENQIEYTVHPDKLQDVYKALIELDEQPITIQLTTFKLDDLDLKEKSGWRPSVIFDEKGKSIPVFTESVNLLVEQELFN